LLHVARSVEVVGGCADLADRYVVAGRELVCVELHQGVGHRRSQRHAIERDDADEVAGGAVLGEEPCGSRHQVAAQ
jgi:hypothetical protein